MIEGSLIETLQQTSNKLSYLDIRSLENRGCGAVIVQQAPQLKYLRFDKAANFGEDLQLLSKLTTLHMLDITTSTFCDDQSISKVVSALPALQHFHIETVKPMTETLKALAECCPNLKHLGVIRAAITDDDFIRVIEKCSGLESVDMTESRITDKGFTAIAEKLPKLKVLKVSMTNIGTASLTAIGNKLVHLTELHISEARYADDAGLIAFFKSRPNLRVLYANCTSGITEKSLQVLAQSCTDLEVFHAKDVQLNDNGIDYLVNGCRKLWDISVPSNRMSVKGALALLSLPNLGRLNLVGNGRIFKEDTQAVLAAASPALELEHSFADDFH
mmetsp:Transcript_26590/g.37428  ORF Transcript_26590/g.37428 Transcript_26590/m.37428 type:complete len:331 (+) Transcript_26590:1288-2280(+)